MSAIGIEYHAKLRRIALEVRRDINAALLPIIKQYAPEYVGEYTSDSAPVVMLDGWVDALGAAMRSLLNRWTSPVVQQQAERIAGDFVQSSLKKSERDLKKSAGIDAFSNNPKMQEYLKASSVANAELIKSIPTKYLDDVSTAVMENMRAGMRPSYIEKDLVQRYGITERRAKFIARDQTSKIQGDLAEKQQKAAGFTYFKWVDSHDARVRHRHRVIANKVTEYGQGVYRWDDLPLSDKGEPIKPGQDYNCFTGESPVNVFYGARKAFRHAYSGELTTIVTDLGEEVVCTPNHPVLTDKGFVAANLINVGDYLVHVPGQAIRSANGEAQSSNIEFGKLFEALELIGIAGESGRALSGDFHGDIANDEKVDVVSFDWVLPDEFDPLVCKSFFELFFSSADKMIVLGDAPRYGDLIPVVSGMTLAPDSVVSGICKLLSFVCAGLAHSREHALASIGLLYSGLVQDSDNDISGNIKFFGDCFDTKVPVEERLDLFKRYVLSIGRYSFGGGDLETPGPERFADVVGVALKNLPDSLESISLECQLVRVTDKLVSEFHGYVYNLEMGEGLFVAHGTAVSNCRCVATVVRDKKVEEFKKNSQSDKGGDK